MHEAILYYNKTNSSYANQIYTHQLKLNQTYLATHRTIGDPTRRPPNSIELVRPNSQRIEPIHAQSIDIGISREIESDNHNEISEDQDRPFKVITLSLAVYVRQEEDAEDDSDHVPLRKYQTIRAVISG